MRLAGAIVTPLFFIALSAQFLGTSAQHGRGSNPSRIPVDLCTSIAGQKWVAPKDVRACFQSFKVDPKLKGNVRLMISM